MQRTGELYGQFETLEQQKDTATLGMWIFLTTEVLFFGGLFMTYTINRHAYGAAFGVGGNTLDLKLGGLNTVVLIMSSLTMAMSVWAAQVGKKETDHRIPHCYADFRLRLFGRKAIEYKQKYDHHLIPGRNFDVAFCVNNPAACGLSGKAPRRRAERNRRGRQGRRQENPGYGLVDLNSHAQLYFSLYFGMTGCTPCT